MRCYRLPIVKTGHRLARRIGISEIKRIWSEDVVCEFPLVDLVPGDLIEIDIPNRSLCIVGMDGKRTGPEEVTRVLQRRQAACTSPERRPKTGVLKRYCERAVSPMKGAYVL